MAFRQADGTAAWCKNDFDNVYSSPILIDVEGLEQLAVLLDGALIGVNPHNGDLQWSVPFKADYSIAVATPVWGPGNLLFISSEYGGGAKVVELQRERHADDGDTSCGARSGSGCTTATRSGSATRSTSRAAGRAVRRF